MDAPGLFDSAWLKWTGAVRHANFLKRTLDAYALNLQAQGKGALRREYDPDEQCVVLRLDHMRQPPPLASLHLGDVVFNFRSSLDHLAWALVTRGTSPPDTLTRQQKEVVQFPIGFSESHYGTQRDKRLPGVLPADEAIIRAHQPYHGTKEQRRYHVFAVLHELSNEDKHRKVWPLRVLPDAGNARVLGANDCEVIGSKGQARRVPLEEGAEVMRVAVRPTGPHPDVDVDVSISVVPAIHETLTVYEWLERIEGFVMRLLTRFAEPPEYLTDGSFD